MRVRYSNGTVQLSDNTLVFTYEILHNSVPILKIGLSIMKVPFSMAIGNLKPTHECFPKH